jgi:hypothetical protein
MQLKSEINEKYYHLLDLNKQKRKKISVTEKNNQDILLKDDDI